MARKISETQRTILRLRDELKMGWSAIGRIVGATGGNTQNLYQRAKDELARRAALAKQIEQYGKESPRSPYRKIADKAMADLKRAAYLDERPDSVEPAEPVAMPAPVAQTNRRWVYRDSDGTFYEANGYSWASIREWEGRFYDTLTGEQVDVRPLPVSQPAPPPVMNQAIGPIETPTEARPIIRKDGLLEHETSCSITSEGVCNCKVGRRG